MAKIRCKETTIEFFLENFLYVGMGVDEKAPVDAEASWRAKRNKMVVVKMTRSTKKLSTSTAMKDQVSLVTFTN